MHKGKHYKTKQRDIVLSFLKENKQYHVTVDIICEDLRRMGTAIGQTTVYRNLLKLVNEGSVAKYTLSDGGASCYQYIDHTEKYPAQYHLACVDCGQRMHMSCDFLDKLASHIYDEHNFNLDTFRTVLYGCCDKCSVKYTESKEI